MTERQIELTWRCSTCQHQNLGRHMVCQRCGNPKDESEEYEMPGDAAAVASVEDPALLRLAQAGANWHCQYCGSNQRALDGGCARCGAGRAHGANARPAAQAAPPVPARPRRRSRATLLAALAAAVAALLAVVGVVVAVKSRGRPEPQPLVSAPAPRTIFEGTVTAVAWKRTIAVERWQLASHEAFTDAVPADAVDVKAAGQRVHHHEDVFDHDETVYDEVEVPDGTRSETYTERVACGEDCTTTPRTCRKVCSGSPRSCKQVCTNNKNGFATCKEQCTGGNETCRDECTGGDRRCATRYCSETRTKQVPKTRKERRPRTVKKYRSEPRYAAWSTYRTWEWIPVRRGEAAGDDVSPQWPDAGALTLDGLDAGAPLPDGGPRPGAEQEQRTETRSVTIRTDDGRAHEHVPADDAELARLAPGTPVKVKIEGGKLTIL